MPLLDLFWAMLWFFMWVIWFWLLIKIFADVFRSSDLSGFGKTMWVIFVIILPFLGVLVYLLARGDSMAHREIEHAASIAKVQQQYIQEAAGTGGTADELSKLADLRDRGVLTNEEFDAQKSALLGS